MNRVLWRVLRAGLITVAGLLLLAVAAAWLALRASLPDIDGELHLAGLSAPVTIERDAAGVPVIHGATREDVARATGYAHAQDRWFQMDLLRRTSAGELSELAGARAPRHRPAHPAAPVPPARGAGARRTRPHRPRADRGLRRGSERGARRQPDPAIRIPAAAREACAMESRGHVAGRLRDVDRPAGPRGSQRAAEWIDCGDHAGVAVPPAGPGRSRVGSAARRQPAAGDFVARCVRCRPAPNGSRDSST